MTTPEEKARINHTLQRLQEEFEHLRMGESVALRVKTSPDAARRLKSLSEELLMLSAQDKEDG